MIFKRTSKLAGEDLDPEDVDADLDRLFQMAGLVAFGPPVGGAKAENFDARFVVYTFVLAATDYTMPHGLGRVPTALLQLELPVNSDRPDIPVVGVVTFGSIAPTKTLVTLRCSGAGKTAAVVLL
jgi:hypothetical protein